MSITRIQNNQITDGTIVSYAKLQAGSLTGNLFAPTVTLNSNVTINGNLFLANSGNTATINATNTFVNDPLVVFNNGYTGSLTGYDIGILVNRNLSSLASYGSVNTAWVWSEADQAFESIATTDTGTGIASINNSGWTNIKVGNATVVTGLTASTIQGAIGTVTQNSGQFTTLAASGLTQITNATNNNSLAYSNGALQVTGGAGFGGNVFVGGNVTVAGNVYSSSGNINVLSVQGNSAQFLGNAAGFGALYAGITSGYVYQPQTVIQASTNFNGYAQVNHQNINGGANASTDFVATMDTGTAGSGYIDMGINSSGYNSASATLSYAGDGYLYVQANTSGSLGNLMLGTAAATGNIFFVTGGQNINNQVMTITTSNTVVVTSTVAATSTSTGALQVQGGLGVIGATYAGSVYDSGNRVLTSLSSSGAGNLTVTISAPSSSTIALPSTGPGTAQWGGQTQLPVVAFDAYGRASTASNIALNTIVVTQAGNTANITANASTGLVGFDLTNTGVTAGTYGSSSLIPVVTTDSKGRITGISTTAPATTSFTLSGTSGTASVGSGSTLTLAGTYGVTVAVGTEYANISTPQDLRTTASPTFAALTSTGVLISSGNIVAASGTASTNTTTGALVVKGGAGVSGDVNIGGNLSVNGTLTYINTTQEIVSGVEIVAGNLVANSGTASSNTTTGAVVVIGGVGISGAVNTGGIINAGGNIVAAASTTSTSVTTGALVVPAGGVGISGNLNAGSSSAIHQLLGNVVIGTGNGSAGALTALEVNQNNATPFNSTSTVHVFGQQSSPAKLTLDSVGTSVPSMFIARTAAGTAASPSAVQSNQTLGAFISRGYGATGFLLANVNQSAGMLVRSTQNFTDTAQGTSLAFNVIPNNSNLAVNSMTIGNDGNILMANSLSVSGYVSFSNVATFNANSVMNANATVTGNVSVQNTLFVTSSTPTLNNATGALQVSGGAAIVGNVNIGANLFVGSGAQTSQLTDAITVFRGTSGTSPGGQYTQSAIVNVTNSGSADWIAYGDNYPGPSNDHGWADVGYTGSAFSDPLFTITKPNDAYLFGSAVNNAYGGNLVLATDYTGSYNDIVIGVGSFYSNSEVARFHGNTSNSGYLNLEYTTAATSTSTGALRVQGGVGVTGAVYAGSIQNTPIGSTTASTGAFTTLSATSLTLPALNGTVIGNVTPAAATFTTVTTGGLQAVAIGNVTPGTAVFTTQTTGGLQAVAIGNTAPGTAVFTTATTGGLQSVAIGNVTPGTAVFTSANSTIANITGTTATTSTTTGALVVAGGTGIAGNLWTGGAVTHNSAQTGNYDFKVYGNRTTNLLWARPNSTYDAVIIGNTISVSSIVSGAALQIATSDSFLLPVGTSAQRPTASGLGTDTAGMIRFSTTANNIEYYNGTAWQVPASNFTVITDQQFAGTGSTSTFTLSSSATTASTIVSINGVIQIPTLAYSVSGTTLTFTENPASSDVIDVRVLTTSLTVTNLTDTSGLNSISVQTANIAQNGVLFNTGVFGGTSYTQYAIDSAGGFVTLGSNVTVSTASVATTIDNLYANTYSSAKYTITATLQGTNIREINEVLMIHNGSGAGAGTATVVNYGTVNTAGNSLVSFTATVSGNIAQLQATTTNANTIFRIKRDYMAI